jgi:hypothetical protein
LILAKNSLISFGAIQSNSITKNETKNHFIFQKIGHIQLVSIFFQVSLAIFQAVFSTFEVISVLLSFFKKVANISFGIRDNKASVQNGCSALKDFNCSVYFCAFSDNCLT